MILRLLPVLALALVLFAAACGGDGDIPEDPRVLQIGTVAEDATYAYAGGGPAGLYAYLAPDVRDRCSPQQFEQALAGQLVPTGFRGLKKVRFEDEAARVTIVWIAPQGDTDVEWVFVPNPEGAGAAGPSWYLREVPGIEGCGG